MDEFDGTLPNYDCCLLGPQINRITSYNVCYTKLLRAGKRVRIASSAVAGKRIATFWVLLIFFAAAIVAVAHPTDGKQITLLIILLARITSYNVCYTKLLRLVIKHEEAYLEEKFKDMYTSYKSHVRRWL